MAGAPCYSVRPDCLTGMGNLATPPAAAAGGDPGEDFDFRPALATLMR